MSRNISSLFLIFFFFSWCSYIHNKETHKVLIWENSCSLNRKRDLEIMHSEWTENTCSITEKTFISSSREKNASHTHRSKKKKLNSCLQYRSIFPQQKYKWILANFFDGISSLSCKAWYAAAFGDLQLVLVYNRKIVFSFFQRKV